MKVKAPFQIYESGAGWWINGYGISRITWKWTYTAWNVMTNNLTFVVKPPELQR